jgi:hypothetical protein
MKLAALVLLLALIPGVASADDLDDAATLLDGPLHRALESVCGSDIDARLARRYEKFRGMGRLGADFTDDEGS